MFSFDDWGVYAKERAAALACGSVAAAFKDGRRAPELSSNPSYAVRVSTSDRLGYISFWKNGLCDMEVIDKADNTTIESASMLEATDATVRQLFDRFVSAFGLPTASNGS